MYVPSLQIPEILFTNLRKLLLSNGLPSVEYFALLGIFQSTLLHINLIFLKQLHLNQWIMFPPPSHHLHNLPPPLIFFLIQLTYSQGRRRRTYMHNPCSDGGLSGGGQRWGMGTFVTVTTIKIKQKKKSFSDYSFLFVTFNTLNMHP